MDATKAQVSCQHTLGLHRHTAKQKMLQDRPIDRRKFGNQTSDLWKVAAAGSIEKEMSSKTCVCVVFVRGR